MQADLDRPSTEQSTGRNTVEALLLRDRERFLGFLRRAGSGDEAEDLLQEAWLRVQNISGATPDDPSAYLYRLLHNLMLDRRRALVRQQRREGDWASIAGLDGDAISDEPGAERALIASDEVAVVLRKLRTLGEPAHTIFRRHRMLGETQRHIAQDMKMGLSTVEKHLRRAYAALIAWKDGDDEA